MIDEPGCTAGSMISSMPVRGPMTIRRRSLAILLRSIASTRSVRAEAGGVAHALHELDAILADAQLEPGDRAAGACSSAPDTPARPSRRCRPRCRRCRDRAGSRPPRRTRRSPRSSEPAYAVNSWPSRIGIASCRCVRPAFTMSSNSCPFAASASRSASNALVERRRAATGTRAGCSSGSCRSCSAPC